MNEMHPTSRKARRAGAEPDAAPHPAEPTASPDTTAHRTAPEPPEPSGKPAGDAVAARREPAGPAVSREKSAAPASVRPAAVSDSSAAAQPPAPRKAKPAKSTATRSTVEPARAGKAKTSGSSRKKKGRTDAPLTAEEVIRRRRRQCLDREDIAAFITKLLAMAVMLAALLGFAFGITPMANDDMAPRISAGDLLLYYRLADSWSIGDVMVFEKEGEQYVGRIVAQGGDTVEVTDQATLVVNGSTVLENDIYYTTPKYENGPTYPLTLGQDSFFVLCDSREGARDSRYFGPVSAAEVKGKVITVVRRSGL